MALPTLTIDLDAIVANWRMFQQRAGAGVAAAVVKADAYGLGAEQIGKTLAAAGCTRFYVAWPEEGAALRRAVGPHAQIIAFHGPVADTLKLVLDHQLQPVLNSLAQIEHWRAMGKGAPAAVHVDVGMNRLGLAEANWAEAARQFPNATRLIGHLSCGDDPDNPANAQQLEGFRRAAALWPDALHSLSATGGTYLGADYLFGEIRPGIGLYGGGPAPATGPAPHTVVTLRAPILQVREVRRGEAVGYGQTWRARARTRLATVGLGYADGFLRSASNRGKAFAGGEKRAVVGRVSMDLMVVDVTGLSLSPGDEIELVGPNMPLAEVAGAMQTIDYEVLTRLGRRLERRYLGG